MIPFLLFAFLSPLIWGLMNVLDKYVLSHRVKNPYGYIPIMGMVHFVFAVILVIFVDWTGIRLAEMVIPLVVGLLIAGQVFFYVLLMAKEDASPVVGLVYTYPILVTILSIIFLKEIIPMIGYFGVVLIIGGIIVLSLRLRTTGMKTSAWFIIGSIFFAGMYEFMIKVATSNVTEWQGIALSEAALAFVLLFCLFIPKIRTNVKAELRNLPWAGLIEFFTLAGTAVIYFAMVGLPATVVSAIAALQPLFVLIFESIAQRMVGNMVRDTVWWPKAVGIILIVGGVVLLAVVT